MIDLRLNDEGDLELGQQAVDENGFLLYYYQSDENQTMSMTNNPDIGRIPVRDIEKVYSVQGDMQLIQTRLKTENPDWIMYDEVGADLTDIIGEMNTEKTAQKGIDLIYRALTYDRAFDLEDLTVTAVPVSHTVLLFDIQLQRNEQIVRYAVTLDLELGITNEFDISKINSLTE